MHKDCSSLERVCWCVYLTVSLAHSDHSFSAHVVQPVSGRIIGDVITDAVAIVAAVAHCLSVVAVEMVAVDVVVVVAVIGR